MLLAAVLHPLPKGSTPTGSVDGWIWPLIVLAVIVAGGVVLGSRR